MDRFWVKIAIFAVIVVGLIVLVKTQSGKVKDAIDFDNMYEESEKLAEAQETRLQDELAKAEAKARRAKTQPTETEQRAAEPKPPLTDIEQLQQDVQAQRLYEMAETEFRIARKPLMSFKKCVDYCRRLIEEYPDSPEAAKARVLLRKIPEHERERWNVTDEEMGL